jgi:hypothetical protein
MKIQDNESFVTIQDFASADGLGLCCTCDFEGSELVLSQCFVTGVKGVRDAVDHVISANEQGGTIPYRYGLIHTMVKSEARTPGMLVSGKGNGAIATIKREWGIRRNLARKKVPVIMDLVLSLAQLQIAENKTRI